MFPVIVRDYKTLIAVLVLARHEQGKSLADVVAHTGGSRAALSEALRGKHELGAARLIAVADALGYDVVLIPRETGEGSD